MEHTLTQPELAELIEIGLTLAREVHNRYFTANGGCALGLAAKGKYQYLSMSQLDDLLSDSYIESDGGNYMPAFSRMLVDNANEENVKLLRTISDMHEFGMIPAATLVKSLRNNEIVVIT